MITLFVIALSSAYCMIKITLLFVKRDDTLLVHTYLKAEMRIDSEMPYDLKSVLFVDIVNCYQKVTKMSDCLWRQKNLWL